jgi:hypothetical protein
MNRDAIQVPVAIEIKDGLDEEKRNSTTLSFNEKSPKNTHLKGFIVFLFNSVIVTCFLLGPAIYFMVENEKNIPNLFLTQLEQLQIAGQLDFIPQIVRW